MAVLIALPGGRTKRTGGTFGGPGVDRSQRPDDVDYIPRHRELREKADEREIELDLHDAEFDPAEVMPAKTPILVASCDHRRVTVRYANGRRERIA